VSPSNNCVPLNIKRNPKMLQGILGFFFVLKLNIQ